MHLFVRLHLNKQIPVLEKYLHRLTQDGERQRSHLTASTTAAQVFQPETPVNTFPIDPVRFNSQVHIGNELGNSGTWSSMTPFSYTDRTSILPAHVEREMFTPKLVDVNYIEGSSDKRWKSEDFPWTKKLEVVFHNIYQFICISYAL